MGIRMLRLGLIVLCWGVIKLLRKLKNIMSLSGAFCFVSSLFEGGQWVNVDGVRGTSSLESAWRPSC